MSDQLPLDFTRAPRMATHAESLRRCTAESARHIAAFFLAHGVGHQFHAVDLWHYVNARYGCAPDTPRRVMSEMANDGRLGYAVVNRRQSLYVITRLPEAEQIQEAA